MLTTLTTVVVFSSLNPTNANAAINCPDVYSLWARGSGQGDPTPGRESSSSGRWPKEALGGDGPRQTSPDDGFFQPAPLSAKQPAGFFNALLERAPADAELVQELLDYTAVGVFRGPEDVVNGHVVAAGINKGEYRSSVDGGVRTAVARLNLIARECADTLFVLGGYSQGAQVIGDTLDTVLGDSGRGQLSSDAASRVAFVALFGDPTFNPRSYAARSNHSRNAGGMVAQRQEYPSEFIGRVVSYCEADDGFCDADAKNLVDEGGFTTSHNDYPENGYIELAANEAAVRLAPRLTGFHPVVIRRGSGHKVDLVLVIDTTTSMAEEIGHVKNAAEHLTNRLFDFAPGNASVQIGLVEYRDVGDTYTGAFRARTGVVLTTNRQGVIDGVRNLTLRGGGTDTPETVYSGLMEAFDNQPWRNGAQKIALLIGDAQGKDPEPSTGFTRESVLRRAFEIDPVNIYTVNAGTSAAVDAFFEPLAEGSDGLSFQNTSNLADEIVRAVDAIANQPVAHAGGPYQRHVGEPILFSGAQSFDPDGAIREFEWDFDSDGAFDQRSMSAVAEFTYSDPFDGIVTLRTTDYSGATSTATTPVRVASDVPQARRPTAPESVTAASNRPEELSASWTASASPGAPLLGYVVRDVSGDVLAAVLPDVLELHAEGFTAGTDESASVQGFNSEGHGASTTSNSARIATQSTNGSSTTSTTAPGIPPTTKGPTTGSSPPRAVATGTLQRTGADTERTIALAIGLTLVGLALAVAGGWRPGRRTSGQHWL